MSNTTQNNFSFKSTAGDGELGFILPESLMRQGLMSDTSEAVSCFVEQRFSNKLQAYLINYVVSVSSHYPIYA